MPISASSPSHRMPITTRLIPLLITVVVLLGAANASAKNLLSAEWKVEKAGMVEKLDSSLTTERWPTVNIGISWQRQGYNTDSGELILAQDFRMPRDCVNSAGTPYLLALNLQSRISEIRLDGRKLAENLNFQISGPTVIEIPAEQLAPGTRHQLALRLKAQFTGGTCQNLLTLSHPSFGPDDKLTLSANTEDCVFRQGADPTFKLDYRRGDHRTGNIKLTVVSDSRQTIVTRSLKPELEDRLQTVTLLRSLFTPGIYHLIASTDGEFFVQSDLWFAVDPDQISCPDEAVPLLKEWWAKTLAEFANIPPEFKVTQKAENEHKIAYLVEMMSWDQVKIYAWLVVPKAPGTYPAILHVPGYGQGYKTPDKWLMNPEPVVELAVCIRGHGFSTETINPGFALIGGFVGYSISDPQTYIYRGAYLDCLRAVDFLCTRPEVDNTRIGVMGMSQGGGLALATAALAGNKIKACAAGCPFLCDLGHFSVVQPCFKHEMDYYAHASRCEFSTVEATLRYFDVKYLAGGITASVLLGTGLYDDDCPSHTGLSAYHEIRAKKDCKIYPKQGHGLMTFATEGRNFLRQELGF